MYGYKKNLKKRVEKYWADILKMEYLYFSV